MVVLSALDKSERNPHALHEDRILGTPREKRKLLRIPAVELVMKRTGEENPDEVASEKHSCDVYTKDELWSQLRRLDNETYSPPRCWGLTVVMGCGAPWPTPR